MARLSTGQTYGEASRATAAQLLGGIQADAFTGALAQGSINTPSLQPRATPVETFQRVGAPTLGGAPKFFAPPDLPNPGSDLANLARSLGGFSTTLQSFGETFLANKQEQEKKQEAAAAAFVGQTGQYGAARTIADLAANLEKAAALGNQDAAKKLQYVREQQNKSVGRYFLERSLEQNAISSSALSLSDRLAATNTIKVNGKDVELNTLTTDDPRYLAHRDSLLFGGVQMSSQGYAKNQQLIMQATLQADEAQRKRFNAAAETGQTAQVVANRYAAASNYLQQLQAGQFDQAPIQAIRTVQSEVDRIKSLGLTPDTQKKLIDGYLEGFAADFVTAVKRNKVEGIDVGLVLGPILRSVFSGPMEARVTQDGKPNRSLILANALGGESYIDQVIAKAHASQIQDYSQQGQMAGIQAQQDFNIRRQAAMKDGTLKDPAQSKAFYEQELRLASQIGDYQARTARVSAIQADQKDNDATYVKPVQDQAALWFTGQLAKTANDEAARNRLTAQLQAYVQGNRISSTAAISIQTTLSAQGSKEVRSYDKDINRRIDQKSKDWESYAGSPGSYGESAITGFESTALYKFRDEARRKSQDTVYQAIKEGKDPIEALNKLWTNSNFGLRHREDVGGVQAPMYTNGAQLIQKNTGNWARSAIGSASANNLRGQAKIKPLYNADTFATDVDAFLKGAPSQNFKTLMKALTTGPGGQKPSEVILNQFRLHGIDVPEDQRQRIQALDGQKISMAPAPRRQAPQQNQALAGIQIVGRALANAFVPPASAAEFPPAILGQQTTGRSLTPNARKWANAIASQGFEGANYNTKFGGGVFDNAKPHPGDGPAGRYQFQLATWKEINGGRNLPMTKANQDRAFVKLAERRGVDVNTASPQDFRNLVKLGPEWASIPIHRTRKQGYYAGQMRSTYQDFLKAWK
jgi:muramidase (phage lysozyme)